MNPALGAPLSGDFVALQKERRILKAFASLVAEQGYQATTVADIVRRAGIARNTFYETFGGKWDVGRSLLAAWSPELAEGAEPKSAVAVLGIEVEAAVRSHISPDYPTLVAGSLREVAAAIQDRAEDEPELLASLPSGRHGLPADFVKRNKVTRLRLALAASIHGKGALAATVADVTERAVTSRRTFYEHFTDLPSAMASISPIAVNVTRGLGLVQVEIAAAGICDGKAAAQSKAAAALDALGLEPARAAA